MISLEDAVKIGNQLGINWAVVEPEWWRRGMIVELEHGRAGGPLTDVTHNNLFITGQIALAHLIEHPRYYQELAKMEKSLEQSKGTATMQPLLPRLSFPQYSGSGTALTAPLYGSAPVYAPGSAPVAIGFPATQQASVIQSPASAPAVVYAPVSAPASPRLRSSPTTSAEPVGLATAATPVGQTTGQAFLAAVSPALSPLPAEYKAAESYYQSQGGDVTDYALPTSAENLLLVVRRLQGPQREKWEAKDYPNWTRTANWDTAPSRILYLKRGGDAAVLAEIVATLRSTTTVAWENGNLLTIGADGAGSSASNRLAQLLKGERGMPFPGLKAVIADSDTIVASLNEITAKTGSTSSSPRSAPLFQSGPGASFRPQGSYYVGSFA